ncbi:hypothetical protein M011DRAFT_458539 [Sporormia fimetaria CBS 119925]|uniref:Rpr2-domain-containing protein n=1 Tax=Sporormia fimetaria CBS 119925 TaxID=1340428 RepID=A0A6A6V9F3_9PLEO|nr:hypothetical protein M011DRAFT_458539 [Sporormia fimetaria CBS 119925]
MANDARLKYLRDAAQLLSVASPTTAANLNATRIRLARERLVETEGPTKEWDALCREACGACGNMLIPGWSCKVSMRSLGKKDLKQRKDTSAVVHEERAMVYSCLRCGRDTTQGLPPKPTRRLRRPGRHAKGSTPASEIKNQNMEDSTKVVKSVNSSSKQRAKARKGGLQAMLAKSKNQSSASSGLDLMDFMS